METNTELVKRLASKALKRRYAGGHEQLLRLERFSAHWLHLPDYVDAWDHVCKHVAAHGEGRSIAGDVTIDVRIRWHLSGPGITPANQHASVEVQARPCGHHDTQIDPVSDEPYHGIQVVELF